MNKIHTLCLSFLACVIFVLLTTPQTSAASDCFPLFNGGVTNQQYCFNPTPAAQSGSGLLPKAQITSIPVNQPQQTKGGQIIYPTTKTKITPDTGPEAWSLPALFFIGLLGFFLRNKAKKII